MKLSFLFLFQNALAMTDMMTEWNRFQRQGKPLNTDNFKNWMQQLADQRASAFGNYMSKNWGINGGGPVEAPLRIVAVDKVENSSRFDILLFFIFLYFSI